MFQSVNDVIASFGAQKYICNNNVATVVYLGTALQKPILVEGVTRSALGDAFQVESHGFIQFKGKTVEVEVFSVSVG